MISFPKYLSIDLETYSSVDLGKCGVYAYTSAPDFEVLLFAYAFDENPVLCVDMGNGEQIPEDVMSALWNPYITKLAFNANFERTCLTQHFGKEMPPDQWQCTAVHSLYLGLPNSLGKAAEVLNIEQGKMTEGKALITYFCKPCKPTKKNGGRTRNLPHHDTEKWDLFKRYCVRDVEVERSVRKKIQCFPVPEIEWDLWQLDQQINDRGVRVDRVLVEAAIAMSDTHQTRLYGEAVELTGLDNPGSVSQLKKWLEGEEGIEFTSLAKGDIAGHIEATDSAKVKAVLELRQEMSKTSVKKYEAMSRSVGGDDCIRGITQFYGAHSGRWAGRIVQLQNLPKTYLGDLDLARGMVKCGDLDGVEMLFGNVPDTLSQLIRTALVPKEGCRFIVADFSAIEARVLAWIAGEQWVMDAFRDGADLYVASASKMFNVPASKISKGNPEYELRAKGKVAVLACGYQGGTNALIAMGALNMGIAENELQGIVDQYREANKYIVSFWSEVGAAAMEAVCGRRAVRVGNWLKFEYKSGCLFIELPSGRKLAYARPTVKQDGWKRSLMYEGLNSTTKQWGEIYTYGGRLVENIVQAIARDCLGVAMLNLDLANYDIDFHVHDEVVISAPIGFGSLENVCEIMGKPIKWAPGLLLRAEGFESSYYKKD